MSLKQYYVELNLPEESMMAILEEFYDDPYFQGRGYVNEFGVFICEETIREQFYRWLVEKRYINIH